MARPTNLVGRKRIDTGEQDASGLRSPSSDTVRECLSTHISWNSSSKYSVCRLLDVKGLSKLLQILLSSFFCLQIGVNSGAERVYVSIYVAQTDHIVSFWRWPVARMRGWQWWCWGSASVQCSNAYVVTDAALHISGSEGGECGEQNTTQPPFCCCANVPFSAEFCA